MSRPSGIEIAKRLVTWADVVAENFRPGVMEKWGMGYEDLKKLKPDIIMCRLSAQGQTGPARGYKAYGNHLNALYGLTYFTGWPDSSPIPPSWAYPDYFVPFFATAVLLAALDYRRRTGKGQMIDMSQGEISTQFIAPYLLEYSANGEESGRTGNSHSYAVPHNVYRCKGEDRWCAIAVFTDEQWISFCKVIGSPDWTKEPRFCGILNRKKNEEELDRLIGEWTISRTAEEVMQLTQQAGIASGVVKTGGEIYEDPQLNKRNFLWLLKHKEMGDFPLLGQPSILSKTPAQARLPSPCLGEHTEYVCKELLGISEQEFDKLLLDEAFT